jgi:tripartite-type tricarboxylate transporter receptor subunit TctC
MCLVLAASIGLTPLARAAEFPTKPINWIVMWRPGGGADTFTRVVAKFMEAELKQKIVVQNVDGGAGTIGYITARNARPDGYTLVTILSDMLRYQAFGTADIGPRDFDVIAGVGGSAPIFIVRAESPFRSLADFVARAKQTPDALSVAVSDIGGYHHIPILLLQQKAGFSVSAVANPGTPQINAALVGGHVDAAISTLRPTVPYIKDGQVRILATFDRERVDAYPDVPTVKESGYDVDWVSINGVGAPKGLPPAIKNTLMQATLRAVRNPEMQKDLAKVGYELKPMDGETFLAQLIRAQDELKAAIKPLIK